MCDFGGRAGVQLGADNINTAAQRASQRRVVCQDCKIVQIMLNFFYSSSFSNSYSSGGGSTAGQILVLKTKNLDPQKMMSCFLHLLEQSSMSMSCPSVANSSRMASS